MKLSLLLCYNLISTSLPDSRLTRYILQRLLGTDGGGGGGGRSLRQRDRAAAEAKIFNEGKGASAARIVYPQYRYDGGGMELPTVKAAEGVVVCPFYSKLCHLMSLVIMSREAIFSAWVV